MKATWTTTIAILASLLIATPAVAETFECVFGKQVFSSGKERRDSQKDPDPVYKIEVSAWREGNTPHMTIAHVTKHGMRHDRGAQYPINHLVARGPNFYWTGEYDRDPEIVMQGALTLRNGEWTYTETRYDRGKLAWRNKTTCIPQSME